MMPAIVMKRSLPLSSPACWVASAISAMMPPSPRLSARITKVTYFTVITMMSAHRISDSTPSTFSGVTGTGWWLAKTSFMV